MKIFENTFVTQVPMGTMRRTDIDRATFRTAAHRVADTIALSVVAHVAPRSHEHMEGYFEQVAIATEPHVYLAPVLRSGLAMLPAFITQFPNARVGMLGGRHSGGADDGVRNVHEDTLIILDPMIATGETLLLALERISAQHHGDVHIASIVAAPEGLSALADRMGARVRSIHVATIDRTLNERGYILPGLGDFGDRYFA